MKKIFAIVAAALVAFSFTSCEKENVGSKFFKIEVSNIESTSANVSVVPADTTVYYYAGIFKAADVVKYTADTLAAEYANQFNKLAQMYGSQALIEKGYIAQGKAGGEVTELSPETEYTVVAFVLKVSENAIELGEDISSKSFKTKEMALAGEVDLGVLEGAGFEDYRTDDGSYLAYATDEKTYDVTLNIIDEDCLGKFTEEDLDAEYSYIWTKEMNSDYGLSIVKAELESKSAGANEATLSGYVIASNLIKYKFSFTHPTVESAGAPKKVAAKKANEIKAAKVLKVARI